MVTIVNEANQAVPLLFLLLLFVSLPVAAIVTVETMAGRNRRIRDEKGYNVTTNNLTVNNNHYHEAPTISLDQAHKDLEEIEWVRQLSTGSAPKRIATIESNNSKEY